MRLPPFERKTLGRVIRGEDPFCGFGGSSGSRVYSQALARLSRKGFVEYGSGDELDAFRWTATDAGKVVYEAKP